MVVFETDRLVLRRLTVEDAPFILRLLNEPSFIQHIGDRGVRNVADAQQYILSGPIASYERHGFGLFLVELRETRAPIGICGLLKRDALDDVDVGFAFVPESWSKGYAYEAVVGDARLCARHASPDARRGHHVVGQRRVDQPAREARLLFRSHGADARRQGRGEAVCPAPRKGRGLSRGVPIPHGSAFVVALAVLLGLSPGAPPLSSAQDDPAALVRAYWAERDADARASLARRIASHADYRPSRLREWLHNGVPFEELAPGIRTITVDAGGATLRA